MLRVTAATPELADGDTLTELDGLALALGDLDALGLRLALPDGEIDALALGDRLRLGEMDADAEGDSDGLGEMLVDGDVLSRPKLPPASALGFLTLFLPALGVMTNQLDI